MALLVAGAVSMAAVVGWLVTRVSFSYERNREVLVDVFPDDRPEERSDNAQTILLLGSDKRGEIDKDSLDGPQDSRSDSMMLVHLPADRDALYFVSIMRDSWVDIPDFGDAKINAAMAYGGIPLTVQVVEDLIGSRIDEVAVIDFEGFKDLTNALGGVTVTNKVAFEAQGFNFPAGAITLDGDEALAFVRTRKAFADGDYQRVRNQQAYMKGAMRRLISTDTLTNPPRIIATVDAISPYIATSEGMTTDYIVRTAASLRNVRPPDMCFTSVPTTGPGWVGDQSVVFLDEAGVEDLREAFEKDTLGDFCQETF